MIAFKELDWKPMALVPVLALVALPAIGSPSTWLTLTVAGLAMGMIIFIIASGLTLVFGLMDVLNFGHGVFIALGAFVATTVLASMGTYTVADSLWMNLLALLPAMLVAMAVVLAHAGRAGGLRRHEAWLLGALALSLAGDAFLMYGIEGNSWIVMGDPVGQPSLVEELLWQFRERCDEHDVSPVFYQVSARYLPVYLDLGLIPFKLGEEAIVDLPGFDLGKPPRPVSVATMTDLIRQIVDAVSPERPVTLVLHDWGCFFGYEFAARHTARVRRIVGVDIGDTSSGEYLKGLSAKEKAMIAGYQLWLALAWKLGPWLPGLANRMTRWMARQIGCRTPAHQIGWEMNYPYAMQWFGEEGGLRGVARIDKLVGESLPALFVYGRRKPFMFHSARWVRQLNRTPGCAAHSLETGHWVMKQRPAEFTALVRAWLERDQPRPSA